MAGKFGDLVDIRLYDNLIEEVGSMSLESFLKMAKGEGFRPESIGIATLIFQDQPPRKIPNVPVIYCEPCDRRSGSPVVIIPGDSCGFNTFSLWTYF